MAQLEVQRALPLLELHILHLSAQHRAQERSRQLAGEWSRAMESTRSGSVRDFVAVGDVEIKVIGADNQILDSSVPIRQILEQLVSKTGPCPAPTRRCRACRPRQSARCPFSPS